MAAADNQNLRVILFVMGIVAVMAVTGFPVRESPVPAKYHLDKLVHVGMFLMLAILGRRALPLRTLGLVMGSVALVSELQQWFVPGRQVEVLDLLANVVGAGLGLAFFRKASMVRSVTPREGQ